MACLGLEDDEGPTWLEGPTFPSGQDCIQKNYHLTMHREKGVIVINHYNNEKRKQQRFQGGLYWSQLTVPIQKIPLLFRVTIIQNWVRTEHTKMTTLVKTNKTKDYMNQKNSENLSS